MPAGYSQKNIVSSCKTNMVRPCEQDNYNYDKNNRFNRDLLIYIVPFDMEGCIFHLVKWQIHPFISKVTNYISQLFCVFDPDPCDSSPCEDGESCLSDGSQYKCVCSAINCEEKGETSQKKEVGVVSMLGQRRRRWSSIETTPTLAPLFVEINI